MIFNPERAKQAIRESFIERIVIGYAQTLGWDQTKLHLHSYPDRMFYRNGRVLFIKFKSPKGKLSNGQKARIAQLKRQEMLVYVVDSVLGGEKIFNAC